MSRPIPKTLLDVDEFSGLTEVFHPGGDGKWGIESIQDVEPILDANKALCNANDGYSPSRELRRAASIPNIVILKWKTDHGVDIHDPQHWQAVKRLLNSSEYAYLRTAPGKL